MNNVTAGQRIKALRTERKITQEKLAQQAGISVGFLSDLENDKTNVGADKLLDIAEALDVSLDYLMKGDVVAQAPKAVALELPASLVRLADRVGLTVTQARQLLGMRQQLLGFRSDTKNTDLESFDWEKLHESVKEFLK
jgi:DNA-binding XRE family transcriptional regulator